MPKNSNKAKKYSEQQNISNNIKPQNRHYNIKKQALGPNTKRGG